MLILKNFQEVCSEPEQSKVLVIDLNKGDTIALCIDLTDVFNSIRDPYEFT
jgi:hypothetical protein